MQSQPASDVFLKDTYPELYGKAKRTIAKPGDRIPIAGLDWRIVTSAGQAIKTPLPGAGQPNPYCATYKPQDADPTENAQSVGSVITFGSFRAVHLGDLTWNKEFDLMCPTNRIGTADVFFVSHHGQPVSNAEVLVHALQSRVAIMNNGTRKGGQPPAMRIIHSAPRLEDLWQVHFSTLSGQEHTAPGLFIANTVDDQPDAMPVAPIAPPQPGPGAPPAPVHNGAAYWIKVSAQQDGSFTVTNARDTVFSKRPYTRRSLTTTALPAGGRESRRTNRLPRACAALHRARRRRAVNRRHWHAEHSRNTPSTARGGESCDSARSCASPSPSAR